MTYKKIGDKILEFWSGKLLYDLINNAIWLSFGLLLSIYVSKGEVYLLSGFASVGQKFCTIISESFRLLSFIIVPFSVILWLCSLVIILFIRCEKWILIQNVFLLYISWRFAYLFLGIDYKYLGVRQQQLSGLVPMKFWMILYLFLMVCFYILKRKKIICIKSSLITFVLLFFSIYFVWQTLIVSYFNLALFKFIAQ